jgi:FkbM family methyltransferase
MNGVTSRLAGAPALHRGVHRYVASGGRGGRRLWQGALRISALPTKGTLRIGTGELPLDLTSPHAELAMYCGWFEPWETQILRRLTAPAAVCVDAGASIGFHTLWLAALAGPIGAVHAFEPSPPAFERLREATAALATVRINRMALADEDGSSTLIVAPGDSMHSTTRTVGSLPRGERVTVPTTSLDSYAEEVALEHVDVLKVDVEGAEALVFRGAERLLTRRAIGAILAEVQPEYGPLDWVSEAATLGGYRALAIQHVGHLRHRAVLADDVPQRLSAGETFTLALISKDVLSHDRF